MFCVIYHIYLSDIANFIGLSYLSLIVADITEGPLVDSLHQTDRPRTLLSLCKFMRDNT